MDAPKPKTARFVDDVAEVKTRKLADKTRRALASQTAVKALFDYEKTKDQGKDFRNQGDLTLYEEKKITQRALLREDPEVVATMQLFWDTFHATDEDDDHVVDSGEISSVTMEVKVSVDVRKCKALYHPDEWDYSSALKEAQVSATRRATHPYAGAILSRTRALR
jgi:hypothetical protein